MRITSREMPIAINVSNHTGADDLARLCLGVVIVVMVVVVVVVVLSRDVAVVGVGRGKLIVSGTCEASSIPSGPGLWEGW